jgi:hypothetical protein
MSDSKVTHPDYIRILERKPDGWVIKKGRLFYKRLPIASVDMNDLKLMYGISEQQILVELFRINGGKVGFYLADLRHKQYYYCGLTIDEVKTKLRELGIGRNDPFEC